jgi:hypothetical protein
LLLFCYIILQRVIGARLLLNGVRIREILRIISALVYSEADYDRVQASPLSVVYRTIGSGYEKGPNVIQSRKGETMTEASRQPKDKNYNLITVLYQSSDNVESLKTYIQDAQAEGDQELVDFFEGILENNLEAAQRAKEMLVPRFQSEQE